VGGGEGGGGGPADVIQTIEKLNAVSKKDVLRVFRQYLLNEHSVITSFVPKGKKDLALKDSQLASVWIEEVKADVANEEVSQGQEATYTKTKTQYDRSEPPFGKLPLVKTPTVWQESLNSGLNIYGIENNELPLVNFDITFHMGSLLDPLEKKGRLNLLARLMNEGTANMSAADFQQAVGVLGSGITTVAGQEQVRVSVTSLVRNLDETVVLVKDLIQNPNFSEESFNQVKKSSLTSIKGREASPTAIASLVFNRVLYGDDHPAGIASNGTTQSVEAINLNDIKDAYAELQNSPVSIHVVGDIQQQEAIKSLRDLTNVFANNKTAKMKVSSTEKANQARVFFVDVPGSKQSVLNIGQLTVPTTHPDFNKINFTNEKLGGGISGDLAQTLRIEKGYTYGAYSWITNGNYEQPFKISTSVRANVTSQSLEIIRDMLVNYSSQFTQEHVDLVQNKLLKENTRAFESYSAKLGTLHDMSRFGKPANYIEGEQDELLAMQLNDFKTIANQYLNEEDMIYVIVGDKATQFDGVKQFAKGEVIELDIFGNRIN